MNVFTTASIIIKGNKRSYNYIGQMDVQLKVFGKSFKKGQEIKYGY